MKGILILTDVLELISFSHATYSLAFLLFASGVSSNPAAAGLEAAMVEAAISAYVAALKSAGKHLLLLLLFSCPSCRYNLFQ